ncbi:MAG: DMT family transporter [Pseudomonadota bacterium]
MELWVPITVLAAFMQNARSGLQKHLKASLSTSGATFSRFVFAAPLAALYLGSLIAFAGYDLPGWTGSFVLFAMLGGLSQIAATALLVSIFSFRNFAVGTTFSKTETVQTAMFGLVILGERVSTGALVGIAVSLVGVVLISLKPDEAADKRSPVQHLARWLDRAALTGMLSGAFFGISAVSYRAASLSLESGDFIIRAAMTLAFVTVFQTVVMAIVMRMREPGQIRAVFAAWRVSSVVGLTGMLASALWFTAMTLQNAAYVRALGQVELVFTFAASRLVFGEQSTIRELVGIGLVTAGVLILVFS